MNFFLNNIEKINRNEGGENMKKLGKKVHVQQETIEAYCTSCTYCGCSAGCPSCPSSCGPFVGINLTDAILSSSQTHSSTTGSLTSNGNYAQLG